MTPDVIPNIQSDNQTSRTASKNIDFSGGIGEILDTKKHGICFPNAGTGFYQSLR